MTAPPKRCLRDRNFDTSIVKALGFTTNLRAYLFVKSDLVGIRTQDPQLRRLLLYPAELRDHHLRFAAAKVGIICDSNAMNVQKIVLKTADGISFHGFDIQWNHVFANFA